MITTSAIRAALLAWLQAALGITVIYGDQASPRPDAPYASLKLLSIKATGFDDLGDLVEPGTQDHKGDRVLTASINVFGSGAWDHVRNAANALNTETIMRPLAVVGLAPLRVVGLDDLTGLMDTEWEPRAHFDQEFGLADEYTDDVGLIEHVEMEGTLGSPSMTHVETYTIN